MAGIGYHVYGVSRSVEEKEERVGSGVIKLMRMDVTDRESIAKALKRIGDFSLLIHSAGFGIAGSAEESNMDPVKSQEETDYYGVLLLNSMALPILRRHERSMVVAISSVAARVPLPFQIHYSAAKYALEV